METFVKYDGVVGSRRKKMLVKGQKILNPPSIPLHEDVFSDSGSDGDFWEIKAGSVSSREDEGAVLNLNPALNSTSFYAPIAAEEITSDPSDSSEQRKHQNDSRSLLKSIQETKKEIHNLELLKTTLSFIMRNGATAKDKTYKAFRVIIENGATAEDETDKKIQNGMCITPGDSRHLGKFDKIIYDGDDRPYLLQNSHGNMYAHPLAPESALEVEKQLGKDGLVVLEKGRPVEILLGAEPNSMSIANTPGRNPRIR